MPGVSADAQSVVPATQGHSDWVTRVVYETTLGMVVSTSLDSTIKLADATRQKVVLDVKHHSKGVHDLCWIEDYSQFVSCGLERDLMLWQVKRFEICPEQLQASSRIDPGRLALWQP